MKHILFSAAVLTAAAAHAEFIESSHTAMSATVKTVSEANLAADDTPAVLEGYITGRSNTRDSHKYLFQDGSGVIQVEIDDKVWRGQTVTPATKIRISGEVDIDDDRMKPSREIEVEHLEVMP